MQRYQETAEAIRALSDTLPGKLLEKLFSADPILREKYGKREIRYYIEDTRFHLNYLAEAVAANEPVLFNEYLGWAKVFFAGLPVTDHQVITNLLLLRDSLITLLPDHFGMTAARFIDEGLEFYKKQSEIPASCIKADNPLGDIARMYLDYLLQGNKQDALTLILDTLKAGTTIRDIYLNVFQVTQLETGRLWQTHAITIAQEHYITAATQTIMSHMYPYLFSGKHRGKKVLVACTAGELHEIGARMVADLFELEGWDSYYFGANTPKESLLEEFARHRPDIIALSVTMTFNIDNLKMLIANLRERDPGKKTKIIVGGYPFTISDKLWEKVGADGSAGDAAKALLLAEELTN